MPRTSTRTRLAVLLAAALATAGVLAAAVPAQAVTWDHERTGSLHFTVAGARYQLHETAIGQQQTTVHIGQHTGTVWSNWRITIRDDHGHLLTRVTRHLYKETALRTALSVDAFPTVKAFRAAEHRALTITTARAKATYFRELRSESIDADQETNVGQVLDYLQTLPADAKPDFDAVTAVHSPEYPGSVTISGTDRTHWSIIVRNTRDGIGSFYDAATGSSTRYYL